MMPKLQPFSDYGQLFTMSKFIEYVKDGYFIDYDGYGHYATKDGMSDDIIIPSDIKSGKISKQWTHVIWFNR